MSSSFVPSTRVSCARDNHPPQAGLLRLVVLYPIKRQIIHPPCSAFYPSFQSSFTFEPRYLTEYTMASGRAHARSHTTGQTWAEAGSPLASVVSLPDDIAR